MLTSDDIWAELRRRRIRAKDIAAALGVAVSTVTRAINGETRTPASDLMDHIASEIGVTAEQLAPNLPHPQPDAQTACPRS